MYVIKTLLQYNLVIQLLDIKQGSKKDPPR